MLYGPPLTAHSASAAVSRSGRSSAMSGADHRDRPIGTRADTILVLSGFRGADRERWGRRFHLPRQGSTGAGERACPTKAEVIAFEGTAGVFSRVPPPQTRLSALRSIQRLR